MARMRIVKPEFWTSAQIVECSPIARLLFIGLWNFCDDAGIHPYSIKRIKMEIFPADSFTDDEIDGLLRELIQAELLEEYEAESKKWIVVTGWHHQRIDKPTYKYPKRNSTNTRRAIQEDSTSDPRGLDERSATDWKGPDRTGLEPEGIGKEPDRTGPPLAPQGGDGSSNSRLVLEDISRANLGKEAFVRSWAKRNVRPLSEDLIVKVLAASKRARKAGKDPPRLFLKIVRTGLTTGVWMIDGQDEDRIHFERAD